jgi:hypothetical protein
MEGTSAFCSQCGTSLAPEDRFCRSCGASVASSDTSTEAPRQVAPAGLPSPPAPPRWRRSRALIAVAALVLVAGGATAAVIASSSSKDEKVNGTCVSSTDGRPLPCSDLAAVPSSEYQPIATSESSATETTPPADPDACETKGIIPADASTPTGRCTSEGTRFVVTNQAGTLKTKTMRATFGGVREATSVSDPDGVISETADGTFVILNLSIANRLDGPIDVGNYGDQAAIVLDNGKQYQESFDPENQADQQSFVSRDDELQPDETASGDFIFDLPGKALRRLHAHGGALVIAELGDDIGDTDKVGVIRLSPTQ